MANIGGFFSRVESFTVIACLFVTIQGMYASGFIPATLSTFESEFGLTALQTSSIVTSYTAAKLILGIPLTYYGGKSHVPRFLGITCFICGLSAILSAVPYLIKTTDGVLETQNLCFKTGHPDLGSCTTYDITTSGLEWYVIIGQVLNGASSATLYTLIPSFINQNAEPTKATRYVGYFYACGPLGVAIGFIWGGIAVDAKAWGVPFFVAGVLMFVLTPFFFLLPKVFEVDALMNVTNMEEVIGPTDAESVPIRKRSATKYAVPTDHNKNSETNLQDLIDGLKNVMTNPVWWCLVLASSVEAFFVTGISNYGPKYIESQYSMTAGAAGMLAGAILVPGAVVGQLGGALTDSKTSKNMKQSTRLTWRIALVAFFAVLMIFFIQCDTNAVETVNAECGGTCHCAQTYKPVCVGDEKLYFNGCYLGCTGLDTSTGLFANCTGCASNNVVLAPNAEVKQGHCESMKCKTMPMFLLVMFIVVAFTFGNNPPANMLIMRIVPPQYSAIGMSANDIIYRLLGTFPGVTAFSAVFDASCAKYNYDICGKKLSCSYYDNTQLRISFGILGAIPKFLSFLIFLYASHAILKYMFSAALAPYEQDGDESELGVSLSSMSSKSDDKLEINDV